MRIGAPDRESVRAFYDCVYHSNAAERAGGSRHLKRLAARIGLWQHRHVLDVGCGTGGWLKVVAGLGAVVAGVDISQAAIEMCRRSLPEAELHCGPAEELPFRDAQFDFISCLGALEHFLQPETALSEMTRVGKSGAQFLLLVPNAGFPPGRLGFYTGTEQTAIKEEALTSDGWQKLFESAGLRVRSIWKDLHILSPSWIFRGPVYGWPVRLAQALALPLWPIGWQYQIYYLCEVANDGLRQ